MATTLGQLSLRISKTAIGQGVDRVLLLGAINDAYEEIGRSHEWMLLEDNDSELVMVEALNLTNIEVNQGSADVNNESGNFNPAQTGYRFRMTGDGPYYIFTYASISTGTLERAYEGTGNNDKSGKLFQPLYSLPAGCDVVEAIKSLSSSRPLEQVSQGYLDDLDPQRTVYGAPQYWAPYEVLNGVQRIEVYPAPEFAATLIARHTMKFSRLTSPSSTFLDWVPEGLLFAGALMYLGDGSQGANFARQLEQLIRKDNRRRPPQQIRMAPEFTAHRARRRLGEDDLTEYRRNRQM